MVCLQLNLFVWIWLHRIKGNVSCFYTDYEIAVSMKALQKDEEDERLLLQEIASEVASCIEAFVQDECVSF